MKKTLYLSNHVNHNVTNYVTLLLSSTEFNDLKMTSQAVFLSFLIVYDWKFRYNTVLVYCRELAPGTVSLTGDRAQGDDNKHDSHYTHYHLYNSDANICECPLKRTIWNKEGANIYIPTESEFFCYLIFLRKHQSLL